MSNKIQTVGYVRVSSKEQNTDRQLDGVALDKVFTDKLTGSNTQRPQLQAMLDYVREGDIVIVHSIDRLSRKLVDVKHLIEQLVAKKVTVKFIKEGIVVDGDKNSPVSNMVLNLFASVAEFERDWIRARQAEGISIAKRKRKYKGGQPKFTDEQLIAAFKKKSTDKISLAALARQLKCHRNTLYGNFKRLKALGLLEVTDEA